jgi:hypothetical protein
LFGVELSSDILLVAVFIQMAIIAILIFTVFFKLNKINLTFFSSSTAKNTELDQKVEKKLTGMQIRLNDILTEISSATKEQNESISKMATRVEAAADDIASLASANTTTANKSTTTTTTAAATTAIPSVTRISSLKLTDQFASPYLTTPNVNASAAASTNFTNNPTRFISGLFDRSDEGHKYKHKSEFLDIDLGSDSSDPSNGDPDSLGSKLQNQDDLVDTHVIHTTTEAQSDIPDLFASSNSKIHRFINTNSSHCYHPLSHNYLNDNNQIQDNDFAPSESSSSNSQFHVGDETIQRIKENDVNRDIGEDQVEEKEGKEQEDFSQNQNDNEIKNLRIEKLPLPSQKNSNPELDKIDEEILSALQRLGGSYESEDKDKPQR